MTTRFPRPGMMATALLAAVTLALLPVHQTKATEASLPIRLNTIGYLPDAEKQASVALPCTNFMVVRLPDGAMVFQGKVTGPVSDADTQEQLYTADFSKLEQSGDYQLEVPGLGRSGAVLRGGGCLSRTVLRGHAWILPVALRHGSQRDLSRRNVRPRHLPHERRMAGLCGRRAHAEEQHERLA